VALALGVVVGEEIVSGATDVVLGQDRQLGQIVDRPDVLGLKVQIVQPSPIERHVLVRVAEDLA